MKHNLVLITTCLFLFLSLAQCQVNQKKKPLEMSSAEDVQFLTAVPLTIGQYLEINAINDYPIVAGNEIVISIKNLTKDCVVLPNDYGISILVYVDSSWQEVDNLVTYMGDDDIILDAKDPLFSETLAPIYPDLDTLEFLDQVRIRILVAGRLCLDGVPSDNTVASFAEITILHP